MSRLEVIGLPCDAEVLPDSDLTGLLLDALESAGARLRDGDVLAVASKVVAKAEGQLVPLPPGMELQEARRTLARQQAVRVVADTDFVLIVETRHGFVSANAGIDTSNLPGRAMALLLPDDPDASAAALRVAIAERTGADVGVVVTDTFGRPWRMGQTDVALGAAGMTVLRDERGGTDLHGHPLEVTQVAVADQVAAAADLVRSKADGTPFVLVRGLPGTGPAAPAHATAAQLVRPATQDLFRTGAVPEDTTGQDQR